MKIILALFLFLALSFKLFAKPKENQSFEKEKQISSLVGKQTVEMTENQRPELELGAKNIQDIFQLNSEQKNAGNKKVGMNSKEEIVLDPTICMNMSIYCSDISVFKCGSLLELVVWTIRASEIFCGGFPLEEYHI